MEFRINLYFSEIQDRVPAHGGIKDHVEKTVNDLLTDNKINLKKDFILYIEFTSKLYYDKIEYVESPSGKKDNFRLFTCYVPLKYFKSINEISVNRTFANFLVEAASFILVNHSMDIQTEVLHTLKKHLDLEFIDSFKFPAPFENQKYVGDEKLHNVYGKEIPQSIVLGYLA